jgi:membrane protein insertase Oxa1/YidC/SpoIIIJ
MIMKLMPIFLPIFSFAMPAGLVVYFIVSNLWRIGQQAFITRKFYTGEHALGNLAFAARNAVIEDEPEAEPAPSKKADNGEKPTVGRNRSTMARSSNRVGGRLRELETKPADRKRPPGRATPADKKKTESKKGAGDAADASKISSRRVTPKSGNTKGKRK